MMLAEKLKKVMQDNPTLGTYGFGSEQEEPLTCRDGVFQVAACCEFLSASGVTKNWSTKHERNSYSLKHACERWINKKKVDGFSVYIGNGALIAAAIIVGAPWKREGRNAWIGVKAKSHKAHLLPPFSGTWLDVDPYSGWGDAQGISEMSKFLAEGKEDGALMVYAELPVRDQERVLGIMSDLKRRQGLIP